MTGVAVRAGMDGRSERRDEVLHRARATTASGEGCSLLLVNLSPGGLMARTDRVFAGGDMLKVELSGLGFVSAEVRWSLGGRIGCQFASTIPVDHYYHLLGTISRA